jgi:hypothetical protein
LLIDQESVKDGNIERSNSSKIQFSDDDSIDEQWKFFKMQV